MIPSQHILHTTGVLKLRRIRHGVILVALLHGHGHSAVLFEQGSRIIRGTDLLERDLGLIGAVVITQPVVASAACEQQRGSKCEGTH